MPPESLKTKDGSNRLKVLKHKGISILSCDFSHCTREEGKALLGELVRYLESEGDGSIRLIFDVAETVHDASQANEWKRHLGLFDQSVRKSAIVGLSPLNRIALGGILAFGRMMGQDKTALHTKLFENHELALDYLATDK